MDLQRRPSGRALHKPVNENTKVWFEGLPKWYPAGYLDELKPLFDGSLARSLSEAAQKAEPEPAEAETEADNTGTADTETADNTIVEAEEAVVVEEEEHENPRDKYAPGRRVNRNTLPDEPCPPTYLGWTIFLTICCCSPVSLAGLVASICVSSFYNSGKLDRARKASDIAAWLVMIAFALGFIPVMLMSAFFGE